MVLHQRKLLVLNQYLLLRMAFPEKSLHVIAIFTRDGDIDPLYDGIVMFVKHFGAHGEGRTSVRHLVTSKPPAGGWPLWIRCIQANLHACVRSVSCGVHGGWLWSCYVTVTAKSRRSSLLLAENDVKTKMARRGIETKGYEMCNSIARN